MSIDGYPDYHDKYRVDTKQDGTFACVYESMKLLDKHGIDYNVRCILTKHLSYHPEKVYQFITQEDIDYIQFIPCLNDLDTEEPSEWARANVYPIHP